MRSFLVMLAVAWLALMPPLFTGGACSAEFDRANAWVEAQRQALSTPDAAVAALEAQGASAVLTSNQQCRLVKPRHVQHCDFGALVRAEWPVTHRVCSIYRDDNVKISLTYDNRLRLARIETDMAPYKSLPLPGGFVVHWAR